MQIDLETVIWCEIRQKEKTIAYKHTEYRKNATDEPICKAEIDTEMVKKKHMDDKQESGGGKKREIKIDKHTHMYKIDN